MGWRILRRRARRIHAEHCGKRLDVCGGRNGLDGAHDEAWPRDSAGDILRPYILASPLREAKIEDLHEVVGGDENVLWLQVAMNEVFGVSGRQAKRDLAAVREGKTNGYRTSDDDFAEGLAV